MKLIEDKFNELKNNPSDINEHLETIKEYSSQCKHITEMGVRWVVSTWAFLMGKPDKMISYDIVTNTQINEVINACNEYGLNFKFIEADVLKIQIEKTELLFIDTLHTYNQLIQELTLHSKNSSKYIILHDTTSFGIKDESIYNHASDIIKSTAETKHGLKNAITDFLITEDGKNWEIHKEYTNNNGLTILKRKI